MSSESKQSIIDRINSRNLERMRHPWAYEPQTEQARSRPGSQPTVPMKRPILVQPPVKFDFETLMRPQPTNWLVDAKNVIEQILATRTDYRR